MTCKYFCVTLVTADMEVHVDEATGQTNVAGTARSRKRKRKAREVAEKDTQEPASVSVPDGGPVKKVKELG